MWLVQLVSIGRNSGWDLHMRWMRLFASRERAMDFVLGIPSPGWLIELWDLGPPDGRATYQEIPSARGLIGAWENGSPVRLRHDGAGATSGAAP